MRNNIPFHFFSKLRVLLPHVENTSVQLIYKLKALLIFAGMFIVIALRTDSSDWSKYWQALSCRMVYKITEEWGKIKDVFLYTITVQGQALLFLKSQKWKVKRIKKLVIGKKKANMTLSWFPSIPPSLPFLIHRCNLGGYTSVLLFCFHLPSCSLLPLSERTN